MSAVQNRDSKNFLRQSIFPFLPAMPEESRWKADWQKNGTAPANNQSKASHPIGSTYVFEEHDLEGL